MPTYWFRAKRYGYGWTPCTWQGWLMTAAYAVTLIAIFASVDREMHSASDTFYRLVLPFFVVTMVLVIVCAMTGEKPRWRWGQ